MKQLNKDLPIHVSTALDRIPILTRLLFLVAFVDGEDDPEEIKMIQKIACYFNYNAESVLIDYNFLKTQQVSVVHDFTKQELISIKQDLQIKYIASLLILANADKKMDQKEWKFIHGLYKKMLNLDFNLILETQKMIRGALNFITV